MMSETCGLDFVSEENSEELYRPYADRIKEYAKKNGKNWRDLRILDIGSGKGKLVAYLRMNGFQAFGSEPNPDYLEASKSLARRFSFPEDSFTGQASDELESDSCDVVIHIMVLEHLPHFGWTIDRFLHHAVRVMKEDGLYLASIPNLLYPYEGHANLWFFHYLPGYYMKLLYATILGKENASGWARAITNEVQYHCVFTIYRKHKKLLRNVRITTFDRLFDSRYDYRRSVRMLRILRVVRSSAVFRMLGRILFPLVASISVDGEGKRP